MALSTETEEGTKKGGKRDHFSR